MQPDSRPDSRTASDGKVTCEGIKISEIINHHHKHQSRPIEELHEEAKPKSQTQESKQTNGDPAFHRVSGAIPALTGWRVMWPPRVQTGTIMS